MRLSATTLPVLLLAFSAFWIAPSAPAQNVGAERGTLSGLVIDVATGAPLAAATVALHRVADSSLVTGATTQQDGTFRLGRLGKGTYYVRVSFVGYVPQTTPDVRLTGDQRQADVGTIALRQDAALLEEVEVSAEREFMEVGIDRTVYNTRNQPITAGGSGRDVLENIPSVEVDIDGNISLRGSQGVQVYLNGKPAPMSGDALVSFLAGLSSPTTSSAWR